MKTKNIAIVGTGIAGLTCGYYLNKAGHNISLFESEDYIGGHTHTVDVNCQGEESKIDTGFIVYNDRTYPNFIKLMDEIGVKGQETEMSFSVRNDELNLEYNGNGLNTLFAQRSNLFKPSFWRMIRDILHFNKDVRKVAKEDEHLTIGRYLEQSNYSSLFKDNYLLPMISAIWSMGLESSLQFPLRFFVKFFDNHGLLNISDRPQWFTIIGGSSSYIAPLTADFDDRIQLNQKVLSVERQQDNVVVTTEQTTENFDEVVFACHGDQALQALRAPTKTEQAVLSNFSFSTNDVVLHTDISHLPRREKAWASWNYRMVDSAKEQAVLTYNMNILQRLTKKNTYMVTLNQEIAPDAILGSYVYTHPVYTPEMVKAQDQWHRVSGIDRIHYCGAYWFNGFHEDGVKSGKRVCKMLGAPL